MSVRRPAENESFRFSRDNEILQALRHHQRALACVADASIQRLPLETRRKLVSALSAGLDALRGELERRGVDARTSVVDPG